MIELYNTKIFKGCWRVREIKTVSSSEFITRLIASYRHYPDVVAHILDQLRQDYSDRGGNDSEWIKQTLDSFYVAIRDRSIIPKGIGLWYNVATALENKVQSRKKYKTIHDFIADQSIPAPGMTVTETMESLDKDICPTSRWRKSYITRIYKEK